jgi:hypothetical protein
MRRTHWAQATNSVSRLTSGYMLRLHHTAVLHSAHNQAGFSLQKLVPVREVIGQFLSAGGESGHAQTRRRAPGPR